MAANGISKGDLPSFNAEIQQAQRGALYVRYSQVALAALALFSFVGVGTLAYMGRIDLFQNKTLCALSIVSVGLGGGLIFFTVYRNKEYKERKTAAEDLANETVALDVVTDNLTALSQANREKMVRHLAAKAAGFDQITEEMVPADIGEVSLEFARAMIRKGCKLEQFVRKVAPETEGFDGIELADVPDDIECSPEFARAMLEAGARGVLKQHLLSKVVLQEEDYVHLILDGLEQRDNLDLALCTVEQLRYLAKRKELSLEHIQRALKGATPSERSEILKMQSDEVFKVVIGSNAQEHFNYIQNENDAALRIRAFLFLDKAQFAALFKVVGAKIDRGECSTARFISGLQDHKDKRPDRLHPQLAQLLGLTVGVGELSADQLRASGKAFISAELPIEKDFEPSPAQVEVLKRDGGAAFVRFIFNPGKSRWNQHNLINVVFGAMTKGLMSQQWGAVTAVKSVLKKNPKTQAEIIKYYGTRDQVPEMLRRAFTQS